MEITRIKKRIVTLKCVETCHVDFVKNQKVFVREKSVSELPVIFSKYFDDKGVSYILGRPFGTAYLGYGYARAAYNLEITNSWYAEVRMRNLNPSRYHDHATYFGFSFYTGLIEGRGTFSQERVSYSYQSTGFAMNFGGEFKIQPDISLVFGGEKRIQVVESSELTGEGVHIEDKISHNRLSLVDMITVGLYFKTERGFIFGEIDDNFITPSFTRKFNIFSFGDSQGFASVKLGFQHAL